MDDSTPTNDHPPDSRLDFLNRIPPALLCAAIGALLTLYFITLARFRLIDGDEGYYLYAARLVLEGELLYRDFFYTQMPLMPYLHAVVFWITEPGWFAGRLVSALCSAALGVLIFLHLSRQCRHRSWPVLGVVLYAGSCLVISNFPVAKTHAISALTVFSAWQLLDSRSQMISFPLRCLLAGLILGLGIDARLMMAGVFPALLWGAIRPVPLSNTLNLRTGILFCIGMAAAFIFVIPFLIADPANFIFGNYSYHAMRSTMSFSESLAQKSRMGMELIGFGGLNNGALGFQNIILLLLTAMGIAMRMHVGQRPTVAHGVMLFILITAFIPTPAYTQYLAALIPFLVVCAVKTLAELSALISSGESSRLMHPFKWSLLGILMIFLLASGQELRRDLITGQAVPPINVPDNAVNWRIETMEQIARLLDEKVPEGEAVLTWWPGYCLGSRVRVLEGLENHFGQEIAPMLDPAGRERHHVLGVEEMERIIRSRQVRMILLGNWTGDWISFQRPHFRKVLAENDYVEVEQLGTAILFAQKDMSGAKDSLITTPR